MVSAASLVRCLQILPVFLIEQIITLYCMKRTVKVYFFAYKLPNCCPLFTTDNNDMLSYSLTTIICKLCLWYWCQKVNISSFQKGTKFKGSGKLGLTQPSISDLLEIWINFNINVAYLNTFWNFIMGNNHLKLYDGNKIAQLLCSMAAWLYCWNVQIKLGA